MLAFAGTTDFYSAAVQVIPVLALVQFVELRSRETRLPGWFDAVLLWAMVAAIGSGEMVGFRALYWGGAPHGDLWIVIVALVVAALAAVLPALWSPTVQMLQKERWYARAPAAVPAAAIVWLIVTFVAVLHR